jgi:hypothetical protein
VTCPECGRTGTATWKGNENSDDADYEMVLKIVSNGFLFGSDFYNFIALNVALKQSPVEIQSKTYAVSAPFPSFSRKVEVVEGIHKFFQMKLYSTKLCNASTPSTLPLTGSRCFKMHIFCTPVA